MIRWLLYRFLPFYLLLFVLISSTLLLVSETGLQLVWAKLQPQLPPQLHIGEVRGRLIGQIAVRNLEYQDDAVELRVADAWLRWSPMSLLRGRIRIQELVASDVQVTLLATESTEQETQPLPETLPSLPNVWVDKLVLQRAVLYSSKPLDPNTPPTLNLHSAQAKLRLENQALQLDLDPMVLPEWGTWRLNAKARLSATRIQIEELVLAGLNDPVLQLSASADCPWPSLDCMAQLQWSQLRWPLQDAQWWSPQGTLAVERALDQLKLKLTAQAHGEQLPDAQLQANVTGTMSSGAYDYALHWQSAASGLNAQGRYTVPLQQLAAKVELKQFDLSPWLTDYPSALNGTLAAEAKFGPNLNVTVSQADLRGPLRGYPLRVIGRGSYTPLLTVLDGLDLKVGDNSLSGNMRLSDSWQGQLQFSGTNLSQLHPELKGKLQLDTQIAGTRAQPDLKWTLKADRLQGFGVEIRSARSQGEVKGESVSGNVAAKQISTAGVLISRLDLNADGTLKDTRIQLQLDESHAKTTLSLHSQWSNDPQNLKLALLAGTLHVGDAAWTAEPGATAQWSAKSGLTVPELCWNSEPAQTCLQLSWQQELQAALTLQHYPLQRLKMHLPPGTQIAGEVNLSAQVKPSSLDNLEAELELTTSAIEVSMRRGDERVDLLQLLPGQLNASSIGQNVDARWQFPAQRGQGLSGKAKIIEGQALDAQVQLALQDVSVISAFVPEVLTAQGALNGQLVLSGPLTKPQILGELSLDDAQFQLDTPEIELKQVHIKLRGLGGTQLELAGHAESGGGALDITGNIDWRADLPKINATIVGSDFLAANTPESEIYVSPNLKLQMEQRNIAISGKLEVPRAQIRPLSLSSNQAIAPDDDQFLIGEEKPAARYAITSQVDLALGNAVHFEGFGLTASVRGKLKTELLPGRVATGVGDLYLKDGKYKAYGQDLTIERGRLIFSGGPLSEPGLDIKAYRQATADVRAGVRVRGPVHKPSFTLYSDPLMRETDQLSYLVLGRAAEAQNENDQAAMNNAALALGLKGGDFLAKRFKSQLGLDEVRIGTQPGEDSNQASLVLGKYLSPDIYVSYGIGLFEPIYTFKLRYRLSERWSLQTESGIEASGDIYYTLER